MPRRVYRRKRSYRKRGRSVRRSKRTFKRRYSRRRFLRTPITRSKRIKLVYIDVDTPHIQVNTGVEGHNSYRANSLFDVNGVSGSRTMVGIREWSNFYSRYRVTGCKIDVEFVNNDQNGTFNCFVLFVKDAASAMFGSWVELMSAVSGNGNAIVKQLAYSNGPAGVTRISKYMRMPTLWGDYSEWIGSTKFSSNMGANPDQVMFVYAGICSQDGGVFTANVACRTKITMYAKLYNKKVLYETLFAENDNAGQDVNNDPDTIDDP